MEVVPISNENAHIFDTFAQDYEAEFSAITKKEPNSDGCFTIEADWRAPNSGFFCFLQEKPAGFAVISTVKHRFDMAEFYILPCYRKQGFGKKFAFAIFQLFPGPWQVRQIQIAVDAIAFWRAVINEYTKESYKENVSEDLRWGKVLRQCFDTSI